MKKILNKLLIFTATLLMCIGCEKDTELTTLQEVKFPSSPEVSHSSIELIQEMENESVVTISWPEVEYPIDAPVNYTLQFAVPADTIGDNAWENTIDVEAGNNVLSKSFLGKDLNQMAKDLGLEADQQGILVVRVQSFVDRTISSLPVMISITPYTAVIEESEIYLPGAYQGWDPETAASIPSVENGVYQGYLTLPDTESLGFKVTIERNWDENYGDDGNGNLLFDGPDLTVPEPGTYQINVDLNSMRWSAELYSWGVVGTATPGGWDTDTDMFYDSEQQVWKYSGVLQPGALKFRLNDSWTVNYGSRNNDEGIAYLDDPGAHNISEAGMYEVTFKINPNDPSTANYTVEPISWGIIGDATAGGWDTDTDMTYDSEENVWTITADLNPGAIKFRRNNEWTINYGPRNNEDGILYLDDPGAHGVTEAGTYDITLIVNPEDPLNASYTIEKVN